VFIKVLTSFTIYFAYHELSCTWLGLTIGSKTDLRSVPINYLTQVQYVEQQEDHNFSRHCLLNPSTSDVGLFIICM